MSLVKKDKEQQLVELALIVTGIRLFNRECGKGGDGIDDSKYRIFCTRPYHKLRFLAQPEKP